MSTKKIILFLLISIFSWIFFFGLRFDTLFLVFDYKKPTPVSPIYYLKVAREKVQSILIMGDRDETEWNFILSQKRSSEAKILCNYRLNSLAKKQSLFAQKYYNNGLIKLNNLIDKIDTNYLIEQKEIAKHLIEDSCQ